MFNKLKQLKKDKRGVFGLTAVQAFFSIILGIGLLAYVIVIIMGILSQTNIVPINTLSGAVVNESLGTPTTSGLLLTTGASALDGVCGAVTRIYNDSTGNVQIGLGNITQVGCYVYNNTASGTWTTTFGDADTRMSYPYTYSVSTVADARTILTNTSSGITSFFGNISPVYAILAILVIILVLVVLVRVVQAPSGSNQAAPSL